MTLQSIKRIIDITMDEDGKYNKNPAAKKIFISLLICLIYSEFSSLKKSLCVAIENDMIFMSGVERVIIPRRSHSHSLIVPSHSY